VGTADLLEMLIAQEPDSDFTFCLGSDTFFDLTEWKWRRSKDILKLLQGRMVVLHRRGVVDAVQRQYPESLQERVDKVNTITLTENNSNEKVILLEVPSLGAVSSSLVRSSCRDEAQVEQLVAEGVLKYIKEHRLYGFSTDLDTITQDNSEKQRTRDI
jgi:nicotinic acid mononucleotide adenylyltransferase